MREARRLQEAGHLDQAADSYRQALQERSEHVAARIALGKILVTLEQPAAARKQLFLALQHDPDQMVARRLLADANLMLGNHLEAHRWLSEYLRVLPEDREAQELFKTVESQLEFPPSSAAVGPATRTLGRLYLEQGHPERAAEVLGDLTRGSADDRELDALVDAALRRHSEQTLRSKRLLLKRLGAWRRALGQMEPIGTG